MPNRLAAATSPYLLQHADNPVDWWEWGPEAFEEARRRDVPVLLSVGYAACHWCHVMAPRVSAGSRDELGVGARSGCAEECRSRPQDDVMFASSGSA
jgi:uncharacterized protein